MTVRDRPRTPRKASDDYTVGYKKPPKATQFKKGQSGNLKGRPKKSKNPNKLMHDILNEEMQFTENGEQKTASKREVIARTQSVKAVQGDHRATDRVFGMDETHQSREHQAANSTKSREELSAAAKAILAQFSGKDLQYEPPSE